MTVQRYNINQMKGKEKDKNLQKFHKKSVLGEIFVRFLQIFVLKNDWSGRL